MVVVESKGEKRRKGWGEGGLKAEEGGAGVGRVEWVGVNEEGEVARWLLVFNWVDGGGKW